MGMSASQARFLSLTARKTNVEYEGQQINQQRTTLSNESSNYYSQLTSMEVPVPPSTADYTKITYTFSDGSAKNTVTSLVATKNTAKTGLYMLNYVQEIPSHNMVVNGTSIVTKTDDKYNIGTVELQKAGNNDYSIEKFTKAGIPYEVVVAMSEKERQQKLAVEQQYVAMASEKYANEDWLVRYQRNSSTGSYEAVLYSLKELQNADYNAKTGTSLSGIRQYVFGETTESREIKNAQAKLTQDSTGRYQTITIFSDNEISSSTIDDTRTDEQIRQAQEWQNQKPNFSDYVLDRYSSNELYGTFYNATRNSRNTAVSDGGHPSYLKYILAHMLDLSLNTDGTVNRNTYPKTFKSSISDGANDVQIIYNRINESAFSPEETASMLYVSDVLRDGTQPVGKTGQYSVTTSSYTSYATDTDKLISDYYIRQGNPTDMQKLLSNYYMDGDIILNKTLRQKCIDMYKAMKLSEKPDGSIDSTLYNNVFVPLLNSLYSDITNFTLYDKDGYDRDMQNWNNSKPSYAEPVSVTTYSTTGGTTYTLTTTTETDDAAYNSAMNQYYYDKAQYDQMVQNINAKIEIIQVQDKNLELKLKQLDTEQNAIQTEMDAVKKVISKNVESSFKTFNA